MYEYIAVELLVSERVDPGQDLDYYDVQGPPLHS